EVTIRAAQLLRHAGDLFARHPVRDLKVTGIGSKLGEVLAVPELARVRRLELGTPKLTGATAHRLAAAKGAPPPRTTAPPHRRARRGGAPPPAPACPSRPPAGAAPPLRPRGARGPGPPPPPPPRWPSSPCRGA